MLLQQWNMEKTVKFLVYITLFVVYIFPVGFFNQHGGTYEKLIFICSLLLLFVLSNNTSLRKRNIILLFLVFIFILFSKSINYLLFLPIIFVDYIYVYKEVIVKVLKDTPVLYICLAMTLFYSAIYFGENSRYAHTAIMEINQSGLAIFCLGTMFRIKNKKVSYFVYLFGLLTISRSYYLSLIIMVIDFSKLFDRVLKRFKFKQINLFSLTMISNLILFAMGILFIYEYKKGNVYWGDDISNRLINLLDYSNYFRFLTIYLLVIIVCRYPKYLLMGMNQNEFIEYGKQICTSLNIPYKYTAPHNLFYSHLRIYGFFSFIETIYVSIALKKYINQNNFLFFIAIFLYSIILGAGLYSYWLFLTVFCLLVLDE